MERITHNDIHYVTISVSQGPRHSLAGSSSSGLSLSQAVIEAVVGEGLPGQALLPSSLLWLWAGFGFSQVVGLRALMAFRWRPPLVPVMWVSPQSSSHHGHWIPSEQQVGKHQRAGTQKPIPGSAPCTGRQAASQFIGSLSSLAASQVTT